MTGLDVRSKDSGGSNRSALAPEILREAAHRFGTPCWVYDAEQIRRRVLSLSGFDVIRYAQKASSNIHLLRMLRSLNVVIDAVSQGEINRALAAGYDPRSEHDIVYASDILEESTLGQIVKCRIPVNIGSPQMLDQLGAAAPGHPVWLRINPGFGSGFSRKTNTGGTWSKHGLWHETLDEVYEKVQRHKLTLVGLHMHIGSGADFDQLRRIGESMISQVKRCPFDIRAISAGGGLPIPYRGSDVEIDIDAFKTHWMNVRAEIEAVVGHPITLEIEPGRFIAGNAGYLVSEVRAFKAVGSNHFVLSDAGFNDLMRPAMYASFHGISVLHTGHRGSRAEVATVVAGPLCEAGDVFTVDGTGKVESRPLETVEVGDYLIFHDCGAYCASMSSNYNSRGLAAEALYDGDRLRQIRKRQNPDDLIALELACGD